MKSPRTNTDVDQELVVWRYYKLTMKIWHDDLRDRGVLSDAEFAVEKAKILSH